MTATFTEGQHAGEFIVSEANDRRSREVGIVASGQNLKDGQLVELSTGKLIAKATNLNTAGAFVVPIEGIVIGNHNASSTGTNADIPGVVYLKRDAEVKLAELTFPAGGSQKTQAIKELDQGHSAQNASAHGIVCR